MTFKQYLIIERFVAEEGDMPELDEGVIGDTAKALTDKARGWLKKLSGKLETDADKAKRLSKQFYDRREAEKKAAGTVKPQGTHQERARQGGVSAAPRAKADEIEWAQDLLAKQAAKTR
jgi:hypothetical protein